MLIFGSAGIPESAGPREKPLRSHSLLLSQYALVASVHFRWKLSCQGVKMLKERKRFL